LLKLVQFAPQYFDQLQTWVDSEDLLLQFSGDTFAFPLSFPDFERYQLAHPDRQFYMVINDVFNEPCGFGEIIPQPGNIPRLGRLLIGNPAQRGKGLGKLMVKLLVQKCTLRFSCPAVELFVLADNRAAVNCYLSAGFYFIDSDDQQITIKSIPKVMRKMRFDVCSV
jgi:RimJ/RimL family protein N-acetyltransferase